MLRNEIFSASVLTQSLKKSRKADDTRYNTLLDRDSNRIVCSNNQGCVLASCFCDESLAYFIFENLNLLNETFSSQNFDRAALKAIMTLAICTNVVVSIQIGSCSVQTQIEAVVMVKSTIKISCSAARIDFFLLVRAENFLLINK